MGRAEMVYRPASLLRAVYATPVATLVAVTSTLATGLPSFAATIPVKLAKFVRASRGTDPKSRTDDRATAVRDHRLSFIPKPPLHRDCRLERAPGRVAPDLIGGYDLMSN